MAQALGARVVLVTGLHPGYAQDPLAGLDLYDVPAASNPRYANSYDSDGNRTQRLIERGEALQDIAWDTLPTADILIVAPAYHELAEIPPVPARVTGVSLQGILRACDSGGNVHPAANPVSACAPFAAPGAFLFFSDEDTHEPEALATALVRRETTVLLTRGHRGATLFRTGETRPHPVIPAAQMVDPTGAGDCFSTAFLVRYAETGDITTSMRFALTAGSFAVEGEGLSGIPARTAIEERLRQVAA